MGLPARPEEACEYEQFVVPDDAGTLHVWIDRQILLSRHLKRGTLLIAIEGYGRFRFHPKPEEDP